MRTRKLLFFAVLPIVIIIAIFLGPGCTIDRMDLHIHYHKTNEDKTTLTVGIPNITESDGNMEARPYVIPNP